MPRFFINVRTPDSYVEDGEGDECANVSLARSIAIENARDLMIDNLRAARAADVDKSQIEITNEDGELVARILFSDVLAGRV